MDAGAVAALRRGQPQVVGGDGADLARPAAPGRSGRRWRRARAARRRSTARGSRYSDCSSSPLLGVNAEPEVRQPLVPRAGLAELRGAVDRVHAGEHVPRAVGRGGAEPARPPAPASSASCLSQHCSNPAPAQWVNRLTLYAAASASVGRRRASAGPRRPTAGRRTSGRRSSVSAVTMPSAPSATTAPGNSASPRRERAQLAVRGDQLDAADGGGEHPVAVAPSRACRSRRRRPPRCAAASPGWAARSPAACSAARPPRRRSNPPTRDGARAGSISHPAWQVGDRDQLAGGVGDRG